jgi:hypothetical protein
MTKQEILNADCDDGCENDFSAGEKPSQSGTKKSRAVAFLRGIRHSSALEFSTSRTSESIVVGRWSTVPGTGIVLFWQSKFVLSFHKTHFIGKNELFQTH